LRAHYTSARLHHAPVLSLQTSFFTETQLKFQDFKLAL